MQDLSILQERYQLVSGRIREIRQDNPVPERYRDYFNRQVEFLLTCDGIFQRENLSARTMEECLADHEALYAEIRDVYDSSYCNPDYAAARLGAEAGRLLCFLAAELRSGIACVFEKRLEEWTILLELFAELYGCFLEEPADLKEAEQTIYWHFHDYSRLFVEKQVGDLVCAWPYEKEAGEESEHAGNLYEEIILHADLTDLRYLYRYGLPVGENERKIAAFLNSLPEEQVQAMADTYTEGYRIGFAVTGKDLSKKKTVGIHYCIGFERMMRAAIRNFAKMGLRPSIAREPSSSFAGIGAKRGAYSTSPNRQYEYDHREDRALYLDKAFVEHRLQMLENAFKACREEARQVGGPAVLEVFGEAPFSPQAKSTAIRYNEKQQELAVYQMSRAGQINNQYIPGEERSFTIIAYPVAEIGRAAAGPGQSADALFEEIFRETVKINTLDYMAYRRMQQAIIDVLDTADHVEIRGREGNETRLSVKIRELADSRGQTAFENCVADVNIPVGEVFTSPVLEGTNGLLHVSEVFLNGLQFTDLKLTFADGMVTDYSCGNFADPDEGRKYIRENVLMHHDSLPMGEFAIGTNTTAYRMGKDYGIADRLPILIAEKCGPHFAVGDTCYSHAEDTAVYNPDGKEIIARDNSISIRRREDPQAAYFNCHTDITIPFDELDYIRAVAKDGRSRDVIRDGKFVVAGTEDLNLPL